MKICLRADSYFLQNELRDFYQIFGRILVFEGQTMYQFCFCAKNAQFLWSKFWFDDGYSKKVTLVKHAQQIVGSPALSGVNGVPLGIGGMLLFM